MTPALHYELWALWISSVTCNLEALGSRMTSLQALFDYEGSIGERESRAAAGIRDVSGSGVLFDEKMHRIIVDYDASRLKEGNITFLLRNAGIRLRNTIGKAAA